METINESSLISSYLLPIVTWVREQFKLSGPTILHVCDDKSGNMSLGWTGRQSPGRPVLVKLGIHKRKFPYNTTHAGVKTTLTSLKEEIVLVLAHELRHAVQIECGIFGGMQGHWAEVDAEREAVKVLTKFRNRR